MRLAKLALIPAALVVAVLVCWGAWAAADGPTADFPGFTPLATNKTGDVAVDKVGNVYVNVTKGGRVEIWKFSPAGEGPFVVADIGIGVAYGLTLDANGDVYAAVTGTDRGVYRVDRKGHTTRLPGTEQIVFANALVFDPRGNLYITESYSGSPAAYGQGGIWRIPPGGEAEIWLRDSHLTGTGAVLGYPVGANGIAYYHGDLYVVNTDMGRVVRVPIRRDGTPGQPDVWAVLQEVVESPLAGSPFPVAGDGLALDVHGNVYVAVVTRLAVVRINAEDLSQEKINVEDWSQETIATFLFNLNGPLFAPLDTPNSLAFGTGKGGRQSLFVTNLGWMAGLKPGPKWPGPGLVKIEVGVPGLQLP